jgi:hypothetical protein
MPRASLPICAPPWYQAVGAFDEVQPGVPQGSECLVKVDSRLARQQRDTRCSGHHLFSPS